MGCGALLGFSGREQPVLGNEGSTDNLAVVEDKVRPDRCSKVSNAIVPGYWHNKKSAGDGDPFDDMFYVPNSENMFDDLLAQSYVGKATQDRPCPKTKDAHGRTPGGCPCVQPGGDPGLPINYRVLRVIRVESSAMLDNYNWKSSAIRSRRGKLGGSRLHLLTSNAVTSYKDTFNELDSDANEVYAFHGTFVRTALAITQTDFKINLAGSNRGGLFGKGLYFTDSVTKADEYSKDEPDGYYENVNAVLVCRLCMGLPYHTKDDQKAWEKVKKGEFDSTCGQRVFKELVVYDANQVYPEYVVLYRRIYKKDVQAYIDKLLKHQFFMQVPLHWRNNSKSIAEGFLQQHRGTSHLNEFLQALIERSLGSRSFEVKDSSRIENSVVWERYTNFKNVLRTRLGGKDGTNCNDDAFSRVEEDIEMCRYSNDAGANSLARAAGYRLPVDELDRQLNEHLMWFAGNEEQAERLTRGAFNKETEQEIFAQDLNDTLGSVQSQGGIKYVLLCRVVCGQKKDAERSMGSSSGLYQIGTSNTNQVYPEYLIKLFSEEDCKNEALTKSEHKRQDLESLLLPELRVTSDGSLSQPKRSVS